MIVASATLETDIFEKYFEGLNYSKIELEAPIHDVEEIYSDNPNPDMNIAESCVDHLKKIFEHIKANFNENNPKKPNILVFLPSIPAIKEAKLLIECDYDKFFVTLQKDIQYNIEELHGGLTPDEKSVVIAPQGHDQGYVRVILATKIAETAITLENIRYVLDSGYERNYYFDEIARLDYMEEQLISESSRLQRKGRAGRVSDGFMFKMYTEEKEKEMA